LPRGSDERLGLAVIGAVPDAIAEPIEPAKSAEPLFMATRTFCHSAASSLSATTVSSACSTILNLAFMLKAVSNV
jgi:hypothetical protein